MRLIKMSSVFYSDRFKTPESENKPIIPYLNNILTFVNENYKHIKDNLSNINNRLNNLSDIKDIQDKLISQNSINQCIACSVEEYTEEFFNARISKASFTILPSKTNLTYTLKHLDKSIAKEETDIKNKSEDLINKLNENILSNSKFIREEMIEGIIDSLNYFKSSNSEYLGSLFTDKFVNSFIYPSNNKFINLIKDNIADINQDEIDWSRSNINTQEYVEGIKSLKCLVDTPIFYSFLNWIIDNNTDNDKIVFYYHKNEEKENNLTLFNLLNIIIDDRYINALNNLKNYLDQNEKTILELFKSENKIENIFNNASEIEKSIDKIVYIYDLICRLPTINESIFKITNAVLYPN